MKEKSFFDFVPDMDLDGDHDLVDFLLFQNLLEEEEADLHLKNEPDLCSDFDEDDELDSEDDDFDDELDLCSDFDEDDELDSEDDDFDDFDDDDTCGFEDMDDIL